MLILIRLLSYNHKKFTYGNDYPSKWSQRREIDWIAKYNSCLVDEDGAILPIQYFLPTEGSLWQKQVTKWWLPHREFLSLQGQGNPIKRQAGGRARHGVVGPRSLWTVSTRTQLTAERRPPNTLTASQPHQSIFAQNPNACRRPARTLIFFFWGAGCFIFPFICVMSGISQSKTCHEFSPKQALTDCAMLTRHSQ